MISYKGEVITEGSEGKWITTGFTFATIEEADAYVQHLRELRIGQQVPVRSVRISTVEEPVTHRWDGILSKAVPTKGD